MMRTTLFATVLFSAAVLHGNTLDLSTGQLGTIGSFSDPHWTIVATPTGAGLNTTGAAYIEQNTYNSGLLWAATQAGANYISSGDCGRQAYTAACGAGTYTFATTFNSVGPGNISFQVAGDNEVKVFLNTLSGTPLIDYGDQMSSTAWTSLSNPATTATALNGTNTLYLEVLNAGSFTGGLLTGTVTGQFESFAAPEPASFALMAGALLGLSCWKRRRNPR